jgi:hypothetical protein
MTQTAREFYTQVASTSQLLTNRSEQLSTEVSAFIAEIKENVA